MYGSEDCGILLAVLSLGHWSWGSQLPGHEDRSMNEALSGSSQWT